MEYSSAFTELAAMIEKDWLVRSTLEIDRLLDKLEQVGRITPAERVSLWEMYVEKIKKAG